MESNLGVIERALGAKRVVEGFPEEGKWGRG
jgi:hypothetical protein